MKDTKESIRNYIKKAIKDLDLTRDDIIELGIGIKPILKKETSAS